jgi:hypothetical protein
VSSFVARETACTQNRSLATAVAWQLVYMSQYCDIGKENKHVQGELPVTDFSLSEMNMRLRYTIVTFRTVFITFVIS